MERMATMKHPTRRGFLTVGGSVFAALALRGLGGCSSDDPSSTKGNTKPSPEHTLDVVFAELTFDTMSFGQIKAKLRTYGGTLPGPAIETYPGDQLKIRVHNGLTDEKEKDAADHHGWMALPERLQHIVPHMLNMTNLHVHGVETVPHLFEPLGTSDPKSAMIAIEPGDDYHYVLPIPSDHAPGLYWYHPHHHGSTAVQVQNGMAGGLIVKGAIDEVPEIKAARELRVVVQDVGLFPPATPGDPWMYSPTQNAIWETFQNAVNDDSQVQGAIFLKDKDGNVLQIQGSDGKQYTPSGELDPMAKPLGSGFSTGDFPLRLFLVDGKLVYEETHNAGAPTQPVGKQHEVVPRFTIQPGEVVRFRFLNGCSDNMIPLVVEGHAIHVLAMDGVNFPAPRERPRVPVNEDPLVVPQSPANTQVILGPGNRVEFLVKGSSTRGVYGIWQNAQKEQFLQSDAKKLAELEVAGAPMDMPLPKELPTSPRHYPLIPEGSYPQRTLVFGMNGPPASYNKIVGIDFFMTTDEELANNLDKLNLAATWEGTDPSADLGLAYMDERVDLSGLKVGAIEEWTIKDNHQLAMMHGSMEGHPFHLHETSFEVIEINGEKVPADEITIQDTVWVPHMGSVKIRLRFAENAVGKSVTHCHIIPHEDSGMMLNILVER